MRKITIILVLLLIAIFATSLAACGGGGDGDGGGIYDTGLEGTAPQSDHIAASQAGVLVEGVSNHAGFAALNFTT